LLKVSGQFHAPTSLSPRKEPPVPIGYEAGWIPEPVWTRGAEKKIPPGNRTPVVQPLAQLLY